MMAFGLIFFVPILITGGYLHYKIKDPVLALLAISMFISEPTYMYAYTFIIFLLTWKIFQIHFKNDPKNK